jgi:magnesium-transporting ATPase (P-type)
MDHGLTSAEVAERRAIGLVNTQPVRGSRSLAGIIRSNVLTRFNAIIAVLAAVVLAVGHPIDAIFAAIMVINAAIGVTQELRAKRTIDRLQILIAPSIEVIRDGSISQVKTGDLVRDDVLRLRPGDQVPVDGTVLEGDGLELDESALTGESDAVAKSDGDDVRAGSFVVAGNAVVRATAVGSETWIHELVTQAKQFRLATSELRRGVDQILSIVGWGIAPIAALLLWSQLRDETSVSDGLVAAVAGVVGLVPQGLVLLVSLALAVAVVRLARLSVVVQDLHAVEGLARVDVICLDKTGTLTTGAMTLDRIETLADGASVADVSGVLAALAAAEPNPTVTLSAAAGGSVPPPWTVVERVPFSSARKWSGARFEPGGTWLVGAPEVLLAGCQHASVASVTGRIAALAEDARRVLLLARTTDSLGGDGRLPDSIEPVALVVVTEQLRSDAASTLRYFVDQDVTVKIISGDNPRTVAAVAGRLGLEGFDEFVDLRGVDLTDPAVADRISQATVFGRVMPQQKRQLVEALQRQGHTVAMTGDGVNDIPALKKADIAIAQDTATPATKAISQLVLLDGRFDRLPAVVAEGRRVFANMERVSALFITKTVYSAVFAVVVGIWGATFPFLPRHVSLVSETTIGIPAFALSFRAAEAAYRPGYLRRVLRFAVPAGLATAVVVLVGYGWVRSPLADVTLDEARTATTLMLLASALWVLYLLMQPVDRLDAFVLAGMIALVAFAVGTPFGRAFYALDLPDLPVMAALLGYLVAAAAIVNVALWGYQRRHGRR